MITRHPGMSGEPQRPHGEDDTHPRRTPVRGQPLMAHLNVQGPQIRRGGAL